MISLLKKVSSFFKGKNRLVLVIAVMVAGYFGYTNFFRKPQSPTYQTAQAQKGTLVMSVTASGQITTSNNVQITIQASGVVKEVFVKNGDKVSQGQKIATLTLDQASQQRAASAWSNYLSAQNTLKSAQAKINTLQSAKFKANQAFMNGAVAENLAHDDPKYIEQDSEWLQTEADYKNQAGVISQAQSALSSASLALSQTSSTITAPVPGVVKGLTITPGTIIALSSQSNSSTSTSEVLGSISQEGPVQVQVSLSEIDSVAVLEGQKVTMTLDAFLGKTFTGKVVSINTNGVVSSGVTTYPAVISFDITNDHMYPNMAVNAKIITKVKEDVLLVPSSAVQGVGEESTVRILKKGVFQSVPVDVGDSNDAQTEITSGINEGDTVATSVTPIRQGSSGSTTSPFGGGGRGGFGGFRGIGGN